MAAEVLVATPAVRNLIREGKGHQIPTQMQAGAQYGMVTMDQRLAELVRARRITLDMAARTGGEPRRPPQPPRHQGPAEVSRDDRRRSPTRSATAPGRSIEGTLEATDEQLVIAKLREMGYVPVSVTSSAAARCCGADMSIGGNEGRSAGRRDLLPSARNDGQRRPHRSSAPSAS